MSVAALKVDEPPDRRRAEADSVQHRPLRCVLMDDSRFDRRFLRSIADKSRYDFDFIETSNIMETKSVLATCNADLVMLDYRVPDGDGIAFAAELAAHELHASVPVIVITGEGSEDAAVRAIRSGAADYLPKEGLSADVFDQAIENAIRRARPSLDSMALISNLEAENAALRQNALRNMRLLKGHAMPLMSLAWQAIEDRAAVGEREEDVRKLARITRNVTGLIDDTVITAATLRAHEAAEPVNLNRVLAELIGDSTSEIFHSHADIRVSNLPVIRGSRAQFVMLFEELLLTAVRGAPLGQTPEIRLGAGQDPDGNPIIWMTENGLPLSARKKAMGQRFGTLDISPPIAGRDAHAWSLCQRIVEKNGGALRITQDKENACKIMIRFKRDQLGQAAITGR